jgi:leucyl-tRNA synthetase
MEYHFKDIEAKWQKYWADNKTFKTFNPDEPEFSSSPSGRKGGAPYYVLDMFPYPSGAGLHVGHPLGYIASDIVARYKRLCGFNVMHPMGYDSFGLPAEQYAIQTGQHPKITTEQNIKRYRKQLDKIGFSFDWEREVRTSDPEYYKWTQWIFIQLFNSWYNPKSDKAEPIDTLINQFKIGNLKFTIDGIDKHWDELTEKEQSDLLMDYRIAYLGEAYVNWCPQLGTVLANDEVKDGVSERGGYPVERKLMKQWNMRITAYAERLLNGLNEIDWTESLKESQRNWIGKSEGTSLKFKIENSKSTIEVFTTRPDTIFGVSFLTLAPEHELVAQITTAERKKAVEEYITIAKNRSERERQADVNKISGVFTGAYAIHPFSGKQIPIWAGDYVLAGYGTGAVMAVPAHDERDFKFANHFGLPKPQVITPNVEHDFEKNSWDEKTGTLVNSDFLNGLEVKAAIKKAIEEIEKQNFGKGKTNYRLRDAVFGRQRYWGEPIPIYYKRLSPALSEGEVELIPCAVDEKDLPIVLPEVDKYLPTETGEPPLGRAIEWKYKNEYEYELSTMPGWAGSSWYFLRYMDATNKNKFVSKAAADYWQNIDLYIGGSEHATGHLLYVRFWTKALKDLGFINVDEPAKKLINQGMIQGRSNFIYRVNNLGEPSLYVSKEKISEWESLGQEKAKQKMIDLGVRPISEYNGLQIDHCKVIPERVNILLVDNDVLDTNKFNEKNEIKDVFIFEDDQTYICGWEVEKMSKSKWNVVSPDDICKQHGADCLRLYEMFLGPLELSKPWNTNGITGVSGFLKKLWRLFENGISNDAATKPELKSLHKTIKKITDDIERFSFNTSVSNFMICVNELTELKCNKREILEPLIILIAPYAPHICEELWQKMGHNESITYASWPTYIEAHTTESAFNYPVSVNGKTKFFHELALTLSKEEIEKEVMALEQTQKLLEGKTPKKLIIVPNKIVNIVV